MKQEEANKNQLLSFAAKLGLTALFILVVLLIKATFNIFMMLLAASLIALYFHGLAGFIQQKTKLSSKWSMALSIVISLIFVVLLCWLIGAKVQSQLDELSSQLPAMVDQAKARLSESSIGQKIFGQNSNDNTQKLASAAKRFLNSTFGFLGDIYVILFLGIFLTSSPDSYKKGIIALVPSRAEQKAEEILDEVGNKLRSWLKGKIFAMAVVAGLTAVGLSILRMPMVLVLALIAGILNFIPNFGPMIAMVPAVLIGLSQGTDTALMTAGLYILVQVVESNFITPMVQKKLVSIPPAMIIFGQLIVGSVTGYLGIILATPLLLIVMVLVQELYIKKKSPA